MLDALFAGGSVGRGYLAESSPLLTGKCGDFRGPKLQKLARTNAFRRAAQSYMPPSARNTAANIALHALAHAQAQKPAGKAK